MIGTTAGTKRGWAGIVSKSAEHILMTKEGATRAPHIRRIPEGAEGVAANVIDKVQKGVTVGTRPSEAVPAYSRDCRRSRNGKGYPAGRVLSKCCRKKETTDKSRGRRTYTWMPCLSQTGVGRAARTRGSAHRRVHA